MAIFQASPLLKLSAKVTSNRMTFKATGTTITALPNDYRGFAGANLTLNVYDELAYYSSEAARRLWMKACRRRREISFRLSVSTVGFDGEPSPLRDLYDRAQQLGTEIAVDTRVHENLFRHWANECRAPWQSSQWITEMQRTLRAAQFKRLIGNEWVTKPTANQDLTRRAISTRMGR